MPVSIVCRYFNKRVRSHHLCVMLNTGVNPIWLVGPQSLLRSRCLEDVGPLIRIVELSGKLRREVCVREVRPVVLIHELDIIFRFLFCNKKRGVMESLISSVDGICRQVDWPLANTLALPVDRT